MNSIQNPVGSINNTNKKLIELRKMNEIVKSRSQVSLLILSTFLENSLTELKEISYEKLFSLHGFETVVNTIGGGSQFIASVLKDIDKKGTFGFYIIATPNSAVSFEINKLLINNGIQENKLACMMPGTDDIGEKKIRSSLKNGEINTLIADAYRLSAKWSFGEFVNVSSKKSSAFLFLVEPECMTTLQIENALETIDFTRKDTFTKDLFILYTCDSIGESRIMQNIMGPKLKTDIDMISNNLYRVVHENDCIELGRKNQLIHVNISSPVVWEIMESGITLLMSIYKKM
jgi:hypothetical protein